MTRVKVLLAAAVAAAGLMAFAEGDISITLNRVQQRYPWNGMVDIDYTVAGVPEPANYFVKFTATTDAGVKYVAHEMLDASTLINASNGTYRVTWVATAEGTVFQDCAEFFTKNAKYKAELVYSGSDKSQIPYPFYVVIDVSGGKDATSYPVAYEYFANTHLATNKYNTAEYKTNKIVLRKIHARTFTMGSPADEVGRESQTWMNKETQHEVTLSDDYYVGMFPITQKQWENVRGGNPSGFSGNVDADICPVEKVTYQGIRGTVKGIKDSLLSEGAVDADSFIGILRDKTGLTNLDLPSEAQWENAARAGTTTSTFFGNNVTNDMTDAELGKYMWYTANSEGKTHGVGQVVPNQWGIYDTLGNVWEFCLDRVTYAPGNDWGTDPVTDPLRAVSGGSIAARGGTWSYNPTAARSACSFGSGGVDYVACNFGFRLAMHAPVRQQLGSVQLWKDGPYWATCNVGATNPQDFGYYFWWGDTVGYVWTGSRFDAVDGSKTGFSFSSGNSTTYKKTVDQLYSGGYIDANNADGKLKPEYDAARKYLKGDWRMPTSAEIQALIVNCDRKWTTLNGVNGYAVTGKGDYASKGIFLPAAGYGDGSSLNYSGSRGYYWSSTPNSDSNYACYLYFYSSSFLRNLSSRRYGCAVRPVRGFAE